MAQKAILVEEDRGRYDIALGAKPVDWPLVKSRAEQVQEVEPLIGWGQWKKVYRVDGATYFVEGDVLKKGTRVRVKPHTKYQHLSKGAVISPPKERQHNGYHEATVQEYLQDDAAQEQMVVVHTPSGLEDIVPESAIEKL